MSPVWSAVRVANIGTLYEDFHHTAFGGCAPHIEVDFILDRGAIVINQLDNEEITLAGV